MNKTADDNLIIHNNFKTFWGISTRTYSKIVELCRQRDSRKPIKDKDIDFHCLKNAEIQRLAMITVVFSSMTLESYINYYGTERFSKSYYEKYLDNLNLKGKWVIVPSLANGKQINTDSEAFDLLNELISLRNKLVHDKTKYIRIAKEMDIDWVTEEDASLSTRAVEKIFNELKSIDSNIDLTWMEEAKRDPYV